jgi:hypothetical protein
MTTKTEEEWLKRFGDPQDNPGGSVLFETIGEDLEIVQAADPLTVWTVIEGDETENQYLFPGFHAVNRIGFIISAWPITQEELDSGEWNEVLWFDENELEHDGPSA